MIKTVVFGGTFDPPHEGHKRLLQSVMAQGYDRAIVIPTKIPPHKSRAGKDDFDRRILLVRRMFCDMENVTVSDIENRREGKSYTCDTLDLLKKIYPDDKLFLLMGSDMLLSIEKWRRFEEILASTPIISAARRAEDRDKIYEYKNYLEKKYKCDIILYDIKPLELSSTQLRHPLIAKIDAHNIAHLDTERLEHVLRVADFAVLYAPLCGVLPIKAYIAALAHDCTKYMDTPAQLAYFAENGIELSENDKATPKVYHQISGAHFAEHTLGITDPGIIGAVRWHTTGRAGMTTLEKLICLADSIEPGREYEGVGTLREIAKYDLDRALYMSLEMLIESVKRRGLPMNENTLSARDYLKKQLEGEKNGD